MKVPGYHHLLKEEGRYVQSLGHTATDDAFNALHGTYLAVLHHWFPSSRGYLVDRQRLEGSGKLKYIVVHWGKKRSPVLVLELQQQPNYNDAGKAQVVGEAIEAIEQCRCFNASEYDTIYSLCGIGLNWMVSRNQRDGGLEPTTIQDWDSNITSDRSYNLFGNVAELVHNIS